MSSFLPTIILRHRKENLQKCSLQGLESREDLIFLTYPKNSLPPMEGYIVLTLDNAPPLSIEDHSKGIYLIDGTWKYAEKMAKITPKNLQPRTLPSQFSTAYPRKQTKCLDPQRGLASVEALFIAYQILNRSTKGLLDNYHWKEQFLFQNNL